MMKKGMIWKGLVVGIIILFIGVSFSPTINFNTVRASAEDEFFEVTTQALGIKGYEDTTVELTREQYLDLEQYLDVFQEKLNQTSTREEAIPLFNDAVVELDKYGLLPKAMNIEQAQRLVTVSYDKQLGVFDSLDLDPDANYFCLVAGATTSTLVFSFIYSILAGLTYEMDVYKNLQKILDTLVYLSAKLIAWLYHNNFENISLLLINIFYYILFLNIIFGMIFINILPFLLLSTLAFGWVMVHADNSVSTSASTGWVISIGLNGLKKYEGENLWGAATESFPGILGLSFPGALGFTGLLLRLPRRSFFLGSAIKVKLISSS